MHQGIQSNRDITHKTYTSSRQKILDGEGKWAGSPTHIVKSYWQLIAAEGVTSGSLTMLRGSSRIQEQMTNTKNTLDENTKVDG